jgi:hypothetical protein
VLHAVLPDAVLRVQAVLPDLVLRVELQRLLPAVLHLHLQVPPRPVGAAVPQAHVLRAVL